jgi:signal transduction histidine kinase
VAAADADRRALERALHDGVQQDLVALAAGLQLVARSVERDPGAAKALLDELATTVRHASEQTAELANSIYPPLLEIRGLASALRSAAARAGIALNVEVRAGRALPPDLISALYWCCLEAWRAAPHGSETSVRVLEADEVVKLDVEVAGNYTDERLERVRDRLEALGGRVTIDVTGAGRSRVSGKLPLSG